MEAILEGELCSSCQHLDHSTESCLRNESMFAARTTRICVSYMAVHTFAAGNRASPFNTLSQDEIDFVLREIDAIGATRDTFVFNSVKVRGTCFLPSDGKIHIKGNIFPDLDSSHPRDQLSVRAVLAHEYYGHRPYREQYLREDYTHSQNGTYVTVMDYWIDEFRASYMAAKVAPGLTNDDRALLVQDAIFRASEAGVYIRYNSFMKGVLYGYY